MDHYTLQNFALEAFGMHISAVYEKLMDLSAKTSVQHFQMRILQPTCKYLEDLIHSNVVLSLADAVTEVTLKLLLETLQRNLKWHRKTSGFNKELIDFINTSFKIAVQLACATTHRSVTTLRCHKICAGYTALVHDFLQLYLKQVFNKAFNFKELVSQNIHIGRMQPDLKKLVHWCGKASDSDLIALSNCNDLLRILDLNKSAEVSDRSIEAILKFRNLTHLNISFTYITGKGKEKLLRGLSSLSEDSKQSSALVRTPLTFLSLTLNSNDLRLIPECLPNLTALELILDESLDLTTLKELNQLTSIIIRYYNVVVDFTCAKSLIKEIGYRLEILILGLQNVDLKFVSKYCPVLKTFGLYMDSCGLGFPEVELVEQYQEYFPVQFPGVNNLELVMYNCEVWGTIQYFLSCFINTRNLKVNTDSNPDGGNLLLEYYLIQPLKEGRLQELNFNGNRIYLRGERAVIASDHGYSLSVKVEDLEYVMKHIRNRKGIQNLGRKVRIVPS
ncbi:hypothetical protein C0J52_26071 [Blattella germanica]|nr:hypothetical protein C0J52_26071 [Blattella germanica]